MKRVKGQSAGETRRHEQKQKRVHVSKYKADNAENGPLEAQGYGMVSPQDVKGRIGDTSVGGMAAELLPYRMSSWPQYLRSEDGLRSIGVVSPKSEQTSMTADRKVAVGGQEIGNATPLPDNAKKEGLVRNVG